MRRLQRLLSAVPIDTQWLSNQRTCIVFCMQVRVHLLRHSCPVKIVWLQPSPHGSSAATTMQYARRIAVSGLKPHVAKRMTLDDFQRSESTSERYEDRLKLSSTRRLSCTSTSHPTCKDLRGRGCTAEWIHRLKVLGFCRFIIFWAIINSRLRLCWTATLAASTPSMLVYWPDSQPGLLSCQ